MADFGKELGPRARTFTHRNGSKESVSPFALDVVPTALLEVGRVLYEGERKYGCDRNWRGIEARQHLRHALNHALAHLAGDRSEGAIGHLARLVCRGLFALEVELDKNEFGIEDNDVGLDAKEFWGDVEHGLTRGAVEQRLRQLDATLHLSGRATAQVTTERCEAEHRIYGNCLEPAGHAADTPHRGNGSCKWK